jgi:hypothetical protein
MRRPALLAVLGVLAGGSILAACSSDIVEPFDPVFTAQVTGAVVRPAAGVATYGVARDGGQTGFTLVRQAPAGVTIPLPKPAISKPTPGTYDIVPADQVAPVGQYRGVARIIVDGAQEEYEAQSGALVITETTPNSVRGTFQFDAVRTSPCCDPAPVTISVAGTYTAGAGNFAALR